MMGVPLHLNKLESPTPKNNLYQVWLQLTYWFFRRGLLIFVITCISPLKKTWPFISTIFNSLYPRMICSKFETGLLVVEKIFFKLFTPLLLSPLGLGQCTSFEEF
jgi:hypothetical protein